MDDVIKIISTYFKSNEGTIDESSFAAPTNEVQLKTFEQIFFITLPPDYRNFLKITNGYEGFIGESYVNFSSINEIISYQEIYEHYPWILYIGNNGAGEMYVIDKRAEKFQFGILSYIGDENDFVPLGYSFEEFIKHLYDNDFWE